MINTRISQMLLLRALHAHSTARASSTLATRWCSSLVSTTTTTTTTPWHLETQRGPFQQTMVAHFHSSPPDELPVRRRRENDTARDKATRTAAKTGEGQDEAGDAVDNNNAQSHSAVTDPDEFRQAAKELLDKVETGLEPMAKVNDVFEVRRFKGEQGETLIIDIGPVAGTYRVEISEDECMMQYSSPVSGNVLYMKSAKSGDWVGIKDGHIFEGMLVRDLIRQCNGLPDF